MTLPVSARTFLRPRGRAIYVDGHRDGHGDGHGDDWGAGGILNLRPVLTVTKCNFDECIRLKIKTAHKNQYIV